MSNIPMGTSKFGRVIAANVLVTTPGSIRCNGGALKLGNIHPSNTYLAVTSNTNGIHLTEFTNTQVWVDSPLYTTQLFTANAGIVASSVTTNSASIAGGLTAQFLVSQTSVTTNTFTASSTTVSGTSFFGGAASFQSTVNVVGATTLAGTLAAQATTLQSLTVNGPSTLNTAVASSLNVAVANVTSLTATTANATTVNVGSGASLTYDTSSAGFENLRVNIGSTPAFRLYNSDQRALFPGGVVTNTVKSQAGQQLVLQSQDATGTVVVAGNLIVQGSTTTVDVTNLSIDGLTVQVARSNTAGPDPDSIADKAGLAVETGTSGFQRSVLWNYNVGGANYAPTSASSKTSDGAAYWEMVGGNFMLTRQIPANLHVGYNFGTGAYAADSTATKVSYRFSIQDDESFCLEKVNGSNLSSGATVPIGSQSANVAIFDIPPPFN